MIRLEGKYGYATVFTDNVEAEAQKQIIELLNQEAFEGSQIRIMPDVHAGAGCVIGFTADLGEKVIPNIVGVDIGCGMFRVELPRRITNFGRLDKIIDEYIPSGFNSHDHAPVPEFGEELLRLRCLDAITKGKWNVERWLSQIGTLGGGNHFIEVAVDKAGDQHLIIHSGSRNLGKQIADHYQKMAIERCSGKAEWEAEKAQIIKQHKQNGTENLIERDLDRLPRYNKVPKELSYLEGQDRKDYLHDMTIAQNFAAINREVMASRIVTALNMHPGYFSPGENVEHTVHNYLDIGTNMIRKGAISARKGERVLIPMNMRDGSLLCRGRGNDEWNQSAPHGAGRLMSRGNAKRSINMEDFRRTMQGIYSTSVVKSTLDEAPQAYKPMQEIIDNIGETVEVLDVLKPVYNFKAK